MRVEDLSVTSDGWSSSSESQGEKVKRGLEIYEIIVVHKCLRAITRSTLIV